MHAMTYSVGLTSLISFPISFDTNHDFNVAEFVARFDHPRVTLRKHTFYF